jgi:hypothetical protein
MSNTPCAECRFCVEQDEGYSNYTVEGVTIQCAKGLHPDGDFDRWYGEDKRLRNVEDCSGYDKGEPLWLDADGDNARSLNTEEQEVYDLLSSRP